MKNIYEMIEQRADDLRMLSTQTEIDYDCLEELALDEPKNHDHIFNDMRGRWNKVSELANEISILVDAVREVDMWRTKYEAVIDKPNLKEEWMLVREGNEELRRQQNRIEDR